MSQIFMVPSELPEATHLPSGLNLIAFTVSLCSRMVATHFCYLRSHIRTLQSYPPVNKLWLSMEVHNAVQA